MMHEHEKNEVEPRREPQVLRVEDLQRVIGGVSEITVTKYDKKARKA